LRYFHNNTLNRGVEWIAKKFYNEIKPLKVSAYELLRSSIEKELTKSENQRIVPKHCKVSKIYVFAYLPFWVQSFSPSRIRGEEAW